MTRWMLVLSAVVAIALLALPAAADWDPDDPHKMHFPQLPDQNDEMGPGEFSWDVKLGDNLGHSVTLADDWLCTESGLVTDIHLWVSWQGDLVGDIGLIQVGIWSDLPDPDPADPQNWSMPQDLLWMGDVAPAPPDPNVPLLPMMFTVRPYGPPSPQGFFDPYGFVPPMYPDHLMTWQINIQLDPSTAFYQEEGTTYWLSVLMPAVIDPSGGTVQAGWKTSEDHWNDDSVFLPMIKYENGAARQPLPWQELRDPLEPSLSLDQAFVITADVDWGDAPDDPNDPNDYPTLAASGGAVHIADYLTFMGAFVDPEGDGQPSANADGDDLNDTWSAYGSDDEDGVSNWSVPLSPGQGESVNVSVSVPGWLNAWIDFNADGDWADAGEQIFADHHLPTAGTHPLGFAIPIGAASGSTYARFRFTSYDPMGGLSFNGVATDGEVEDYLIQITENGSDRDFGDAMDTLAPPGPNPYPTYFASNGARHYIVPGIHLGASVDTDSDGQPTSNAVGDDNDGNDDEDGVVFTTPLTPGNSAAVAVTAATAGYLNLWVDFNANGSWADAGEHALTDVAVSAGANHLIFSVPGTSTIGNFAAARFRFTSYNPSGALSYAGLAIDGEVEDYQVQFEPESMDYGDAPFQTLLSADGARHFLSGGRRLGATIDPEGDGQPSPPGLGDDNTGSDDEDGITFTTPIVPGQWAAADVSASPPGAYLQCWIDANKNNTFDVSEQVCVNRVLPYPTEHVTFLVPSGGPTGTTTYMRFRYAATPGLGPTGYATDGEVEDYVVELEEDPQMDYGDSPESATSYPTTLANDGPRHWIGSIYLGSAVDGEFDGQPTTGADGDDNTGTDDEDGVEFPTGLRTFGYAQAEVEVVGGGYFNGWIDYNDDGDWDDVGEHVFNDVSLSVGEQQIDFDVPGDAVVGDIHARFRISSQSGLGYSGEAPDGEVEDYELEILQGYDFGDAPSSYGTLDASSGAKHQIVSGYYLGSSIDAEADGQPERRSAGDDEGPSYDDEDAIRMVTLMVPGSSATVEVTSSSAGKLSAWVDFSADGDWGDAGEKILNDVTINGIGAETFGFSVPADADLLYPSYARFRFNSAGGLSYVGTAVDGEVEDHILENELFSDGFESGNTTAW